MSDEPECVALERVLAGFVRIPAQPQTLLDIRCEQGRPEPSLQVVGDLIARDPALAGPILAVVNSSFYALPNRVTSVEHAVGLLGISTACNLATGIAIRNALDEDTVANLTPFWDAASDVAACCTVIARELRFQPVDAAYLLGLFHNAGIPLLLCRHPECMMVMHEGYASGEPVAGEESRWHCTHASLGYLLARRWDLPADVCRAIQLHHAVEPALSDRSAEHASSNTLLAMLKLAEHLCSLHRLLGSTNRDLEWAQIGAQVLDHLQIGDEDVEELRELGGERGIRSLID